MNQNAFILKKEPGRLVADDMYGKEILAKIKNGEYVKVTVKVPRNVGHHRLFFAMLNLVFESQPFPPMFATVDGLLDAIKIATGHCREVLDLHGNTHTVPESISFGAMDQIKFRDFFDSAVSVILERVLPNCPRADLEKQLYNILGEPGPDVLRG